MTDIQKQLAEALDGMLLASECRFAGKALRRLMDKAEVALKAHRQSEKTHVFLVATGETYEGEKTYTRYEGEPPPLCDYEGPLYAAHGIKGE